MSEQNHPIRDAGLLRKVGDVIAAEPERYDQSTFGSAGKCGTVACVAGHAVTFHPEFRGWVEGEVGCVHGFGDRGVLGGSEIMLVATELLGLNRGEGWNLFSSDWRPAGDPATPLHERVRDALYALADGASVEDVTA